MKDELEVVTVLERCGSSMLIYEYLIDRSSRRFSRQDDKVVERFVGTKKAIVNFYKKILACK